MIISKLLNASHNGRSTLASIPAFSIAISSRSLFPSKPILSALLSFTLYNKAINELNVFRNWKKKFDYTML